MIKRNIYYTFDSGTTQPMCDKHVGVQHAICNMRVSGIVAPLPVGIGINARNPRIAEVRDPKHVEREGLSTLANEATSDNNSQPSKGVLIYDGRVLVGRRHKPLTQC